VCLGLCISNELLYVLDTGQHGLAGRDNSMGSFSCLCRLVDQGVIGAQSFGNRVNKMLAEALQSARLETRTKESNMYASWWVENP
jgi:hypothetical protein